MKTIIFIATMLVIFCLRINAQNYNPIQKNPFSLTTIPPYNSIIAFADLDGDSDLDIMSGSQSGDYYYFENIGTASSPSFASFQKNPFSLTDIPDYISTTAFADLDGDGDLDLMSGSQSGDYYYFKNIGTASSPSFASFQKNPFSLTKIPDYISTTAFADLDGDGDLDLMSGSQSGNYYYYKNIGAAGILEVSKDQMPVIIYPNPFSTQTILQSDYLFNNATLTVDNFFGQTVVQIKNINGLTISLQRDNLPSGLYFIQLTENNKIIAIIKILIID